MKKEEEGKIKHSKHSSHKETDAAGLMNRYKSGESSSVGCDGRLAAPD